MGKGLYKTRRRADIFNVAENLTAVLAASEAELRQRNNPHPSTSLQQFCNSTNALFISDTIAALLESDAGDDIFDEALRILSERYKQSKGILTADDYLGWAYYFKYSVSGADSESAKQLHGLAYRCSKMAHALACESKNRILAKK